MTRVVHEIHWWLSNPVGRVVVLASIALVTYTVHGTSPRLRPVTTIVLVGIGLAVVIVVLLYLVFYVAALMR